MGKWNHTSTTKQNKLGRQEDSSWTFRMGSLAVTRINPSARWHLDMFPIQHPAVVPPYAWLDAPGQAVSERRFFGAWTQKCSVAGKRYPCLASLILKEANQMETGNNLRWVPLVISISSLLQTLKHRLKSQGLDQHTKLWINISILKQVFRNLTAAGVLTWSR